MMIGTAIKQPITLNASFIKSPPCKLKFSALSFARRFNFSRQKWKIMVICASVCKPDTPGWWDLEPYSFLPRNILAADNIEHGHTSTWHFENPNPVRHPSIHKYSRSLASIEIPGLVFFEPYPTSLFYDFNDPDIRPVRISGKQKRFHSTSGNIRQIDHCISRWPGCLINVLTLIFYARLCHFTLLFFVNLHFR